MVAAFCVQLNTIVVPFLSLVCNHVVDVRILFIKRQVNLCPEVLARDHCSAIIVQPEKIPCLLRSRLRIRAQQSDFGFSLRDPAMVN